MHSRGRSLEQLALPGFPAPVEPVRASPKASGDVAREPLSVAVLRVVRAGDRMPLPGFARLVGVVIADMLDELGADQGRVDLETLWERCWLAPIAGMSALLELQQLGWIHVVGRGSDAIVAFDRAAIVATQRNAERAEAH